MKPDKLLDTDLSELELAIANRTRKTFEFEVPNILGHSKQPLGKIRMRPATLLEQEQAIKEAYAYADRLGSSRDEDSMDNIKTNHILHKVCLHITLDRPAFKGPAWMIENLGMQEIAILLNNYNEILRVVNPVKFDFDTERLQAFAELCSKHGDTEGPNLFLQELNRDAVAEIAIRIGILYHETRQKA